jgi:hypothetical protein
MTESTAVRQVHIELVKPERFVEHNTFLGISGVTDFCFGARRWKQRGLRAPPEGGRLRSLFRTSEALGRNNISAVCRFPHSEKIEFQRTRICKWTVARCN